MCAHHVYDEGSPELLDVSEFSPVDDEEYIGEGVEVGSHADPDEALDAARAHGAVADRWVNSGMVGDEYGDARGWT